MSYKLVQPEHRPESLIPKNVVFKGGTIEGQNGILIDGKLHKCTVIATDNSTIHISAIAELTECTIKGCNLLIEGVFEGHAYLKGDCEVAPSATAIGKVELNGDFFKSRLADAVDLHMTHIKSVATTQPADLEPSYQQPQAA